MKAIKNGHLIVNGQVISDIDFSLFTESDQIFDLIADLWVSVEKAEEDGSLSLEDSGNELFEVFGQDFHDRINNTRDQLIAEKESRKPVTVDGVGYQQAHKFDIYRKGWASDCAGWVIIADTGHKLVLSDHGVNKFCSSSELNSFIQDYERLIVDMSAAISTLKNPGGSKNIFKSEIVVNNVTCRVHQTFDVYWCGWEMDNSGWVVSANGESKLVLSSHGALRFAEIERLEEFISHYKSAILATQIAIDKIDSQVK